MLPFVAYHYHLADSEKDLGVHVIKTFHFNEQCEKLLLLTKTNQKFGILKRTCYFVTCKNRQIVLYLALFRGQFERPGSIITMNKFESFQKECLEWILSE